LPLGQLDWAALGKSSANPVNRSDQPSVFTPSIFETRPEGLDG
jgi:hypothetical protein